MMGWTERSFVAITDDDGNIHHGKQLRMHFGIRRARSNNIRQERILADRRKARLFKWRANVSNTL